MQRSSTTTPTLLDFSDRLCTWQAVHGRNHLPWVGQGAYAVWLSEVMLQQTQVTTVLPYYARFIKRFPTVHDLASAHIDDVLQLWAGLGYYSRARNLYACAQAVVTRFEVRFPPNIDALITLPGIGPSTAAAIASLAFDMPAAIMDGNVKRVIARHAGIAGWPGEPAVLKQLQAAAQLRLNHAPSPNILHRRHTQGLMDLGAMVCTAKSPRCDSCPVALDCSAWQSQSTADIPAPRPKKVVPKQYRHALVLHDAHGVWLMRRPAQGLWGGLLSLPEAQDLSALCIYINDLLHVNTTQANSHSITTITTISLEHFKPWHIHHLKHTFTHYQLHWTVMAVDVSALATQNLRPYLPSPHWQYVLWTDVAAAGVPRAVSKVLC